MWMMNETIDSNVQFMMVFFCWLKMSNQFQSFGCHIDDYSTKKKLKTEKSNNIKQTTTNKQIHITSHKLNIWFFIFTIFQCWREKNEFHNQWHIHSVMVEWFFDIYFFLIWRTYVENNSNNEKQKQILLWIEK